MSTFINPVIIICKPIKNKRFGYKIILDMKKPTRLMIKAESFGGRTRGIAGRIYKDGTMFIEEEHAVKLNPLLEDNKKIKTKIDLTLDLIFGINRDKKCSLSKGLVIFQK